MMLYTFRKAQPARLRRPLRSWGHLFVEALEDRVVPSIADGMLLVATSPSSFASTDQSGFPTGIIGVDPSSGAQILVSGGPTSTSPFTLPTYITERPDGQLYVTDLYATGLGAVFRVDPNSGTATLLASGTYINGPNAAAFVNGFLYVADGGPGDGSVHNIVRIDAQGNQTLITNGPSRIDGGTNPIYFVVPTGMVPGPGDTVYLADEPGGYKGPNSGAVWQINLDTGQQTLISSGGFFNHPVDVAVDASGNIIVANTGTDSNNVAGSLFKINPLTKSQTSIVSSFGAFSGTDSVEVGESGTIFVGAIARGTNPGAVLAVNPSDGSYRTLSLGGSLSLVEGMRTYRAPSIQAAATSTTVTSSLNPSVFGQSVTFTATVLPTGGSGIPTGFVTFFDGAATLGAVLLNGAGLASFPISTLTAGTHALTASYSGDSNFLPSSGTISQVVNKATTNTTLISSSNPSVVGQQVSFTATVSSPSGGGTPTGFVQFQIDNGNPIAVGLSGAGTATYAPGALTVGTHTLTATYTGDGNFLNSSTALTQTVAKAATASAVTSSPNPAVFGQAVTFTATVSVTPPGAGTPTGAVQFVIDNGSPVSISLSGSGTATYTTNSLTAGTHTVTASYTGDISFLGSNASLTQTVNKAATTTTVTSSTNPSQAGQSVTFTATVSPTPPGAGTPTGSVQFVIDNGTPVSISLSGSGTATYTTNSLTAGTHTVTASYTGDISFLGSNASLTQTVNKVAIATTTTVSLPSNPAVFGQSVSFTATVSPQTGSGTPTGSVQFVIDNGSPVTATLSGGTATYTTSALTVGTHTLTASYQGDGTFAASSSTLLTQTVNQANTSTLLTSSSNQSVFGQAVTFTATVSATPPGAGTPTGAVQFVIDNGSPVTATLSGGTATSTTSALTVGTHTVTASYTGDGNFLGSSSASTTQTVNQANTSTLLTSSSNQSVFGQAVTFTATVSATPPGAGTPTGAVQFVIDNGSPVTATLSGGTATYTTSALTVGTHTVTASYTGDGNFLGSSSASLTQTVNQQPPTTTTTISSSANPSVFGQSVTFTATVSPQTSGTPTGSVQFVIDNGSPVTVPLSGSGTATYTPRSLAVGLHAVTASYLGDGNFLASSGTFTQAVNQASTSVAVSSSLNPSPFAQPVTFTATVSVLSPGAGSPTGTIQFQINGNNAGSPVSLSSSATASFTTTFFSLGNQTVTAIYSGDSNFVGSSGTLPGGQQVFFSFRTPTTTAVSSSANPSLFGQNVTFTATVGVIFPGAFRPTGTVQFVIDGSNAGNPVSVTTVNGVTTASYSTASLAVGLHSVQAVYNGDVTFASSSGTLAGGQTVNPGASTPTATTVGSSLTPAVFGQNVTFTATITASGSNATPTGTVQFQIDGSPVGGAVMVSGAGGVATASFSTASLTAGTHTITASYSGDATFLPSSGSFTQSVRQASTTTAVSSALNPAGVGQTVAFTATISVPGPGGGTPTGTVQFQIDGSPVGSPVMVSGAGGVATASFNTTFATVGTHTITASYSGDANFTGSSGSFTETVQSSPVSTANVSVTLDPTTGVLTITGDSSDDAFTVTQSAPGVLQIAGDGTLINQSSSPASYALSAINAITIALANGNDRVALSNFRIPGTLSLVAGTGSDSLTLDTITANLLSLTVAGPGADTVTLKNLNVGSASVTAGANATLTLSGITSAAAVFLTAGSNATIAVSTLRAGGDLNIAVGDNTQAVTVQQSSANNLNLRQTGTSGSPLFDLEYDTLNNLTFQAGNGNNRLVFSHLQVAIELLVFLGTGNNSLRADHVTALFGLINGGPGGNNVYINGGGNSGFFVFNFQQG